LEGRIVFARLRDFCTDAAYKSSCTFGDIRNTLGNVGRKVRFTICGRQISVAFKDTLYESYLGFLMFDILVFFYVNSGSGYVCSELSNLGGSTSRDINGLVSRVSNSNKSPYFRGNTQIYIHIRLFKREFMPSFQSA